MDGIAKMSGASDRDRAEPTGKEVKEREREAWRGEEQTKSGRWKHRKRAGEGGAVEGEEVVEGDETALTLRLDRLVRWWMASRGCLESYKEIVRHGVVAPYRGYEACALRKTCRVDPRRIEGWCACWDALRSEMF